MDWSQVVHVLVQMVHVLVEGISTHKDFFAGLESIVTMVAIPIAGVWALRRFAFERPFEPALHMELSASAIRANSSFRLLHVEMKLKNTGRAVFELSDQHSWIKVYALNTEIKMPSDGKNWFNWDDTKLATKMFEGWFTDAPSLVLESGEEEDYAADIAIPVDISVVNIWVRVTQTITKGKKTETQYYWSTQRVFDLSKQIP